MRCRRLVPLAVVVAAAVAAIATAAGAATVSPLVLVSGPSPFGGCTIGGPPGTNYVNAEVEPWVTVNPTAPSNVIGVFQQDRWSNGGAHGLVAAPSSSGGSAWGSTFAHFSLCSGGTLANGGNYDRASDPWVTFTPTGVAYQISLSANLPIFFGVSAVLVSKSTNGGLNWSEPATLARNDASVAPFNFNDKESITADPTDASGQRVYAVWDRSRFPSDSADFNALHSFAFRGDIIFSRTTNGGASWEPARDILNGNANLFTSGNQIAVEPDGTLVDIFGLTRGSGNQRSPNQFLEAVIRSTDHGLTWSDPIVIATDMSVPVRDPDTGAGVRTGAGLPDIAVDPNDGTLYAVWADGRFSGGAHDDILFTKSTDGGRTWSMPIKINQTPDGAAAFTPSVHVLPNGTVGVTYYDFRNNTAAAGAPTDYFIVISSDGGAHWSESRITPVSFDIETAPVAGGYFLGDYEGLDNVGNAFLPLFVMTNSGNTSNRTDVFAATVTP